MLKYSLKRLGYMAVVLVILSVIMYMIYSLVPANRAYSDADAQVKAMKNTLPKEQLADYFDKLYLEYQRKYGTDTDNKFIRYGRWVGIYPL